MKNNILKNHFSFHIVKREQIAWHKGLAIRAAAVLLALIVSGIVITLLTDKNPLAVYKSMWNGAFGMNIRVWSLFQDVAILLCISLAVTPAFKMKFWNIGAEGQVLIGGLATVSVMMFLGDKLSLPLLLIVMIAASVLAGIIWAVVPAIFKAYWNTNETLFTLMMNYVAIQLVSYFLKVFVKTGSGVLFPMPEYGFPVIFNQPYLLNIIIVAVLTVVVYIYLKFTKHGYEISVVGESQNTANYIGINVKKVVIRTLIVSGALCGIAGLLLVGGTNHTINTETAGGRGFTAIMVSWLAKFNPLLMIITAAFVTFLDQGASQISTNFNIDSSFPDMVVGIVLFFIIGCEFFINYKLKFRTASKKEVQ